MICPNCHNNIPNDSKFCPDCGTAIVRNSTDFYIQKSSDKSILLIRSKKDLDFCIELVHVTGGKFTMGRDCNERPWEFPHTVELTDYYISKYLITPLQVAIIMKGNTEEELDLDYSCCNWRDSKTPSTYISWNECQIFLSKLSDFLGISLGLPTEAQWEFAAKGGIKSQRYLYSGSNNYHEVAYLGNDKGPIATKRPNELGLYDMTGNVYEWCNDWFDEYYYPVSESKDPHGPSFGTRKVYRGGCYGNGNTNSEGCLLNTTRNFGYPDLRYGFVGFRIVTKSEYI